MCVLWELNPQPFVLLTQCSTTEPQEHRNTSKCLSLRVTPISHNKSKGTAVFVQWTDEVIFLKATSWGCWRWAVKPVLCAVKYSKQSKIKRIWWSCALNVALFISSAVSFIRKKDPCILSWKYHALTTDMFNLNIFVTPTAQQCRIHTFFPLVSRAMALLNAPTCER